jgi:hypothetical protein
MTSVRQAPYRRYEEFLAGCADIDAPANVGFTARTPTTAAGTPTSQSTNPVYLNPDGSARSYIKLDPGDVQTATGGGSQLETLVGCWVRIDNLPAADADIAWALTNTGGVNRDCFGVNAAGQFYIKSAGVTQATSATVRNVGQWYWCMKLNDGGGGSTRHVLWVDGVPDVAGAAAGGVKNNPSGWGSANFDGSVSDLFAGQGTTSLVDATVLAAYKRMIAQTPGARGGVLM